jgi:DNA-binding CsgD family transcriptional regulator/PAS domain-containing protein
MDATVRSESEALTDLVGDIYDAVLDASVWPSVLKRCTQFAGGMASALIAKDAATRHAELYYHDGAIGPYYQQLYFEKYSAFDPTTVALFFGEIDEPVSVANLMPYEEFLNTRFYHEWARPQSMVDSAQCVLDKSATSAAVFTVMRHKHQGVVDEEMRNRLRLLAPHIRRSILIGRLIDLRKSEVTSWTDALNTLSVGIFLLDGSGRIVHANSAGHLLLEESEVVRASNDRLVTCRPEMRSVLEELLAASREGDTALGTKGIAVSLMAANEDRYIAHLLPLTSRARGEVGKIHTAIATVFIKKAEFNVLSSPAVIANHYKLTPTELRVLLAVVQVEGKAAAEKLGIAETTLKTHVIRLFTKMGVKRRADLVKLVAGYSNVLTS